MYAVKDPEQFGLGRIYGIKKLNRIKQPFKKYPMDKIAYVIKSGKEGILWIKAALWNYVIFDIRKEQFVPYSFGKDSVMFVYNSGGDLIIHAENGDVYTLDSLDRKVSYGPFPKEFIRSPLAIPGKAREDIGMVPKLGLYIYLTSKQNG